ncbi:biotin transporter BioY [Carnobacteriaceae bacterium zg-ZUI78]|uniref:biotin transporter BioY n=1 Tax=Granulicatella sp. zg-84 TaxID=2678503 RepID=UPI0013BFAB9B|nr:biotin transporter BioY [Granulicatella sp. zg-84]MBS4750285.1 biotin transporter BioY [Carnobacteriaceae bacterium zg-ZUI78]NEW66576.1 hypothetical protein [Granulicatella sp. zg-84]QMI85777.1 biotin transporter BioY [Carnobacteriaceae bacterium zg-84]
MKPKDITLISLFAVLTFVSSYFILPIGPVPVTTQTFFIIVTGLLLKPFSACLTQIINIMLMCVFKSAFASPTFGFLLGFVVSATILSLLTYRKKNMLLMVVATMIASICIYLVGIPYFVATTHGKYTFITALSVTLTPFIIGDTIKAIMAIIVAKTLRPLVKEANSKKQ